MHEKIENIQISNSKQIKIQFLSSISREGDGEKVWLIKIPIDNRRQVINFVSSAFIHCYPTQEVKKVTRRILEKKRNDKLKSETIPLVVFFFTSWPEFTGPRKISIGQDLLHFHSSNFSETTTKNGGKKMKNWIFPAHVVKFLSVRLSSSNSSGSNSASTAIKNNFTETQTDETKNVLSIFEMIFMIYRLRSWNNFAGFPGWSFFCFASSQTLTNCLSI